MRLVLLAVFLCTPWFASAATIDRFDIATFGHYLQDYDPNGFARERALNFGNPDVYYLNDGSSWETGAGSFPRHTASPLSVTREGDLIRYALSLPTDGYLWNYTDYNSGDHSSKGALSIVGSELTLVALDGSTKATVSGLVEISSNPFSNYTDDRYNFYSANVGDRVPFEIDFVIFGGDAWSEKIFESVFSYAVNGQVTFASTVPLPATLWLFIAALAPLSLWRRKR